MWSVRGGGRSPTTRLPSVAASRSSIDRRRWNRRCRTHGSNGAPRSGSSTGSSTSTTRRGVARDGPGSTSPPGAVSTACYSTRSAVRDRPAAWVVSPFECLRRSSCTRPTTSRWSTGMPSGYVGAQVTAYRTAGTLPAADVGRTVDQGQNANGRFSPGMGEPTLMTAIAAAGAERGEDHADQRGAHNGHLPMCGFGLLEKSSSVGHPGRSDPFRRERNVYEQRTARS
jgi:hypothetical protein